MGEEERRQGGEYWFVAVGWMEMPLCRIGRGRSGGLWLWMFEVLRVWIVGLDEFWVEVLLLGAFPGAADPLPGFSLGVPDLICG
jgi:hypothetical protein